MSLDVQAFLDAEQTPLIRNGRYQIPPAKPKQPKSYMRMTNLAAILEDAFALQGWTNRGVLRGSPFIAPARIVEAGEDFKTLTALCEEAMDLAGCNIKREWGTFLHDQSERADRGFTEFAEPLRTDLLAYSAALAYHQITILDEHIETVVVAPAIGCAGRVDRIVQHQGANRILDLKSGTLHPLSVSVQLAGYAHAETIYDPATQTHTPMPPVDQSVGLVAHIPMHEGRCDIYTVDLVKGWEYALLSVDVRDRVRKDKDLLAPLASFVVPSASDVAEGFDLLEGMV